MAQCLANVIDQKLKVIYVHSIWHFYFRMVFIELKIKNKIFEKVILE